MALFTANSAEQLMHVGGSPTPEENTVSNLVTSTSLKHAHITIKILAKTSLLIHVCSTCMATLTMISVESACMHGLPFDPTTPNGLGASFSSSTLKSMGISWEEGGLYSCDTRKSITIRQCHELHSTSHAWCLYWMVYSIPSTCMNLHTSDTMHTTFLYLWLTQVL